MHRLEKKPEEWLDRSAALHFTFEGRRYQGYSGDTISSALAAAGLTLLARSFKYHRPRSILSFANHDSNTLFQVDGVPNVRGDVTLLREGMRVSAINTFGGLAHDKARVLDRFARLLPVGFYYKAFHSKRLFPWWERMFRALTGLGEVTLGAERQTTPKRYGFCDVLVIGGGPSGVSAALAAAEKGARVALVEESFRLAGNGAPSALVRAAQASAAITVYPATVAAGYYADHWVALAQDSYLTKMRAKAVVFATGVVEQPAVFRNNDLPGVMLASGALRLLARYGVAPGRRVVVVAANLEAYVACLEILKHGVPVVAIVELRAAPESDAAVAACAALGIEILNAHAPYEAIRGSNGTVAALRVAPWPDGRLDAKSMRDIECDAVLMSVGWAAAAQLCLQAGGTMRFSDELQQFVPADLPSGVYAAGRVNGVYEIEARLADGRRAGAQAAAHAGFGGAPNVLVPRSTRCPSHRFPIIDHPQAKNFVDFDEDLQVKDLENAAQEGFDSSELLKRYSTVGMGPSQGKHSHMNALRILARFRGLGVDQLGLTTARPMYHPVPMKLLAGRSFSPERRTPIDALHGSLGAVWMPAGNWRRPQYYAVAGESRAQSIDAEVHAVRNGVGLIDVGTLGKIEIYGPDAAEFLDRVYAGRFSDLAVGMTRYGLMLDESGVIIDDGVIARLGGERFYFTTTTGGSAAVFREMLRLNASWGLDCALVNVTGHRAAFNLAGPLSREILQGLTNTDLRNETFPYLSVRSADIAGVAARLMRVGFVGELGYEIHVAAGGARDVWRALLKAGAPRGLRPFGVEAQRVLRLEKGHFIVGQDTDGLTDPLEANAMWAVAMKKPFFVGQRSLRILQARGPRQKLVGIELDAAMPLPKECHLIIDKDAIAGRVTSVAHSRVLNKSIGLAMLAPELAQAGRGIRIRADNGAILAARVVAAPFYDPKNLRQKADVRT
ncbi:MAG TPA: 2Fe-2S iron-sulfur cluster-binding protein [Steroidobacteraceae bacterium]|jgi:sarcosine oxidase subunit alpha|nr:2Fe-2S iron-sulfur cluster-binding protein [Steroidobacteraceae bacterium]